MSTFKVSLETLDQVWQHPNADKLELASVRGMSFQFVVLKDKHKPGDEVLYFPIDSLLPPKIIEALGLTGRLAGKEQNRLKTIKLRGQISQGLVCFPADLDLSLEQAQNLDSRNELTQFLGVVKFDPPPVPAQNADLVRLPQDVEVYDIEGADRFANVLDLLLDQRVRITEKLEGTNWSITLLEAGEVVVNQRGYSIIEHEGKEHYFWSVARNDGWIEVIKQIQKDLVPWHNKNMQITLRGELIGPGIQKNIYKLKEHKAFLFDVLVGTGTEKHYLNRGPLRNLLEKYSISSVPTIADDVILRDWLDSKTVQEASNGKSLLNKKTRREGIVITPMEEQQHPEIGRLILKMRSPEYLAKSDF